MCDVTSWLAVGQMAIGAYQGKRAKDAQKLAPPPGQQAAPPPNIAPISISMPAMPALPSTPTQKKAASADDPDRRRRSRNRSGTILNGAAGIKQPSSNRKTLLGGALEESL